MQLWGNYEDFRTEPFMDDTSGKGTFQKPPQAIDQKWSKRIEVSEWGNCGKNLTNMLAPFMTLEIYICFYLDVPLGLLGSMVSTSVLTHLRTIKKSQGSKTHLKTHYKLYSQSLCKGIQQNSLV